MGLLQALIFLAINLCATSLAVDFTDEQAGLLATGNYDYYGDPNTSEDMTGASSFKNPAAPTYPPRAAMQPPEQQFPYYPSNKAVASPLHSAFRNPISSPQTVQNSPQFYQPRQNYQDVSQVSQNLPYPQNNDPYAYTNNNNNTDPNAPKVYNYKYDKVDDADPNHITEVHSEAHQSHFKFDNNDGSEPPTHSQIVRPIGYFNENSVTPSGQQYSNPAIAHREENMMYPNRAQNTNSLNINQKPDTALFPNRQGQSQNYPYFPNNDDNFFGDINGVSHDFNNNAAFQRFLNRFRFYPKTASRW